MRPQPAEAAPYYSRYIDLIAADNVVPVFSSQLDETSAFLGSISEAQSLKRYAPGKWSIRDVLGHVNDSERIFAFRALWFARGFQDPLPTYDQEACVKAAKADTISWVAHVEEFRNIRLTTISLFKNLPDDAWSNTGIASDNRFTVRSLAYIIAGHVAHHVNVIQDRYLEK